MSKLDEGQQGFSLIEIAIVIVISGLLMAMAVSGYKQYLEKQRIHSTQAKMETLREAMDRFFEVYSHYPCPASFSAGPGDADFGVATDCYSNAVAAGSCSGDYCVSQVTRDHDNNPGTPDKTYRIRQGSIPFQSLKEGIGWDVDETSFTGPLPFGIALGSKAKKYQKTTNVGAGDTIDSYKNRFTYALTETQGTEDYLPRLGAIEIRDEHGQVLTATADYVFIGHGRDGSGARTFYGEDVGGGCSASLPKNERENCDNDHIYVSSLRYDANTPNKYDDMLFFLAWKSYYLWDVSDKNRANMHNLNAGKVGIGGKAPKETLHVYEGNVLADKEARYTQPSAGSILAAEYCNYDATGGVGCFDPEKIGGTGMDCDVVADNYGGSPGAGLKVMQGIKEQQVRCARLYDAPDTKNCPSGQFPRGVKYSFTTKKLTLTGCR